jgi:3-deoxy-manno-octulosonate cytidylyltransferase (CMP-KDO synthetase)
MNNPKVVGMIPARLESSRLPAKALKDICGLPAIAHTCLRTQLAKRLHEVYVATDSPAIRDAVLAHGGQVIMTGPHRNGSERIAEAVAGIDGDVIVNIQGDEILIDPDHIDAIVEPMLSNPALSFCVGVTPFDRENSPADFKAVTDRAGNLLYCSRADIPYRLHRGAAPENRLKMVFVVGFRRQALLRFVNWEPTPLELSEPNEFLRILEYGERIQTVRVENSHVSLDTEDDLKEIRLLMARDTLRHRYQKIAPV